MILYKKATSRLYLSFNKMAGFKVRVLFLATSLLSVFTLSSYLLLSSRNSQHLPPKSTLRFGVATKQFSNDPDRPPAISKSVIESLLLDLSNREDSVNCSRIDRLCRDEQLITYKHAYDIIRQDVINFSHIILIVTFNKPHFEAISKVHRLYWKIFPTIIYCVPNVEKLPNRLKKLVNVSIVEYAKEPTEPTGASFYMCLPIVLELLSSIGGLNYIDGILTISDDLIPNLWHFRRNRNPTDVLRNRLWLLNQQMDIFDVNTLRYCRGFSLDNKVDCDIVGKNWTVQIDNQPKLKALLEEASDKFPNFVKQLSKASRGDGRIFNNYADLFYVSAEFFEKAYDILRLFGKHEIYMEFAVGTALRGIASDIDHQIDYIDRSGQLGPEERYVLPSDMYDARRAIYHPFKLSHLQDLALTEQCVYCAILSMTNTYSELMLSASNIR